jgi:hypothetical protein
MDKFMLFYVLLNIICFLIKGKLQKTKSILCRSPLSGSTLHLVTIFNATQEEQPCEGLKLAFRGKKNKF